MRNAINPLIKISHHWPAKGSPTSWTYNVSVAPFHGFHPRLLRLGPFRARIAATFIVHHCPKGTLAVAERSRSTADVIELHTAQCSVHRSSLLNVVPMALWMQWVSYVSTKMSSRWDSEKEYFKFVALILRLNS